MKTVWVVYERGWIWDKAIEVFDSEEEADEYAEELGFGESLHWNSREEHIKHGRGWYVRKETRDADAA